MRYAFVDFDGAWFNRLGAHLASFEESRPGVIYRVSLFNKSAYPYGDGSFHYDVAPERGLDFQIQCGTGLYSPIMDAETSGRLLDDLGLSSPSKLVGRKVAAITRERRIRAMEIDTP